MTFSILGRTQDHRTKTHVIYCKCSINDYLHIIGGDFENFSIQRKRESHKAYRRLKEDLKNGALLPSITLALKHNLVENAVVHLEDHAWLNDFLSQPSKVDILDGLQRTYLIKDLVDEGHEFPDEQEVLLEYWFEDSMSRLIYRMIVLNAGQKAMSMRHQVELLFMSLKETISSKINGIEIFSERDNSRRTQPNKYSLGILASAYQAFLTRSTEIDKNDVISSTLIKDTVMDSSEEEHAEKFDQFIKYFNTFKDIDALLWAHYESSYDDDEYIRLSSIDPKDISPEDKDLLFKQSIYKNAKSWFASENVLLGVFCAISQLINTGKADRVDEALSNLSQAIHEGDNVDPLGLYSFERYKDEINPRKSNVGNATRKLILNGFKEFFRDEGQTPFSNCWEQASD
ncbi:hypothetical protein ACK35Y_16530 [Aeromonas veronii]|uniref:hypothetical protein n=1 Tax=Aeromonas veronii TaxID=654 RepID=UPI003A2C10C0